MVNTVPLSNPDKNYFKNIRFAVTTLTLISALKGEYQGKTLDQFFVGLFENFPQQAPRSA
jgi:hypothetical protein